MADRLLARARSYKDELRKQMRKAPSFVAFAAQAAPTPQTGSNVLGLGFGAKSTEGTQTIEETKTDVPPAQPTSEDAANCSIYSRP